MFVSYSREAARLVGTALYIASQGYRPGTNVNTWEYGSFVSSFDLSNAAKPVAQSAQWVSGNGNVIAATDRFLFVATPVYSNFWFNGSSWWSWESYIRVFDISSPDGTVKSLSTIQPFGQVKDKFKMNVCGDTFVPGITSRA